MIPNVHDFEVSLVSATELFILFLIHSFISRSYECIVFYSMHHTNCIIL